MTSNTTPFSVAITGASRGIGAEIARYLATAHTASAYTRPGTEAGLRLVLVSRDEEALQALADDLSATACSGVDIAVVVADLSDIARLDDVAEELWEAGGLDGLDALVNNAGISITGPATSMTSADWQSVLTMNLSSPALLAAAVGRRMSGRGTGRIVNVTSVAGSRALAEHYAYCSSKAGLIMATKVLATELGSSGVRVNSVSPTVVLTEMGTRVWGEEAKAAPMLARIATGHFAQPEDVAAAVTYLLSPGAEMITGHDLVVDGGFSAV